MIPAPKDAHEHGFGVAYSDVGDYFLFCRNGNPVSGFALLNCPGCCGNAWSFFPPPILFRSLLSFFGFVFAFGSLLAGSLQAVP